MEVESQSLRNLRVLEYLGLEGLRILECGSPGFIEYQGLIVFGVSGSQSLRDRRVSVS